MAIRIGLCDLVDEEIITIKAATHIFEAEQAKSIADRYMRTKMNGVLNESFLREMNPTPIKIQFQNRIARYKQRSTPF